MCHKSLGLVDRLTRKNASRSSLTKLPQVSLDLFPNWPRIFLERNILLVERYPMPAAPCDAYSSVSNVIALRLDSRTSTHFACMWCTISSVIATIDAPMPRTVTILRPTIAAQSKHTSLVPFGRTAQKLPMRAVVAGSAVVRANATRVFAPLGSCLMHALRSRWSLIHGIPSLRHPLTT